MTKKLIQLCGLINIIAAILLFGSWCSIGLFMWKEISNQDFVGMVLNPNWIPVNIVYLVANVLLLPSLIGLYLKQVENAGRWGLIGFLLSVIGVTWYACITYYEAFFWPVIAAHAPNVFKMVGFSPTNKLILGAFLLSGIFWSLGYIIIGITTIRSGHFAKWAGVLFTVGAVLFGFGMVIPIRTIGVLLFSIGMIRIGNQLWKNKV